MLATDLRFSGLTHWVRGCCRVGMLGMLSVLACCSSAGAGVYAEYRTGGGSSAFDPTLWLWRPSDIYSATDPQSRPVVDTQYGGQTAWQITDMYNDGRTPNFLQSIEGPHLERALNQGWSYRATARLVDDFGKESSQGLAVYLNNVVYLAMVDFTPAGELYARLFDETATLYRRVELTGVEDARGYHEYELRYNPSTELASFYFDGEELDAWNGFPTPSHPNVFHWGAGDLNGAGQMNFREVVFSTLDPTPVPGDFDGDGQVSASDYSVWKNQFGATGAALAADSNGDGIVDAADYTVWRDSLAAPSASSSAVPEPGAELLLLVSSALAICYRGLRITCPHYGRARRA